MTQRTLAAVVLTAWLLAACQRPAVMPVLPPALPTFTPRPTERPFLTAPVAVTAMTFTPTVTQPATATPNASATLGPTATPTRRRAVVTFTPTAPATSGAAWFTGPGGGAHGITGQLSLNARTTTFSAGSRVEYTFELNNTTGAPINYGILGVGAYPIEAGSAVFGVAWDAAVTPAGYIELKPGPFKWSTYIIPKVPGRYAVHVAMCFSAYGDCGPTGDWQSMSPDIFITVN
jgi:hypothetical protein